MNLRAICALASVFVMLAAGCSSSSASGGGSNCTPGAMQSCSCSSGGAGTATCDSAGVYGECACGPTLDASALDSGTSGGNDSGSSDSAAADDVDHCSGCGDGGGLGDSSPLDAAAGAFGAMCTSDTDCTSMDCSQFPAKGGGFCTVPCTTAADCPPQAQGCNGMGQCKVP